jgi:3-deoxy-D-manno-oct-2-ulosonic acid (Kdo) hydroxylase
MHSLGDQPMNVVESFDIRGWDEVVTAATSARATQALESGKLVLLPDLAFSLDQRERAFLTPECTDGKAKNISYDPSTGAQARGSRFGGEDLRALDALMARYAELSARLIDGLFPHYRPALLRARNSFRPARVEGRITSARKDDTRLHADAFPSSPTQGRRILRVFSNVNPDGRVRLWHVGEPFEDYAQRFLPQVHRPWPGSAWLLERLGVTKGRRAPYDSVMLQLHDLGKLDEEYQRGSPRAALELPAGSTWVVYTDQVLHAALAGQYLFEQTFHLPVDAMVHPENAPLSILERLSGRSLS